LNDAEGVLGPTVTRFVEDHVRSLLAWDVVVFFHRNQDVVITSAELAERLGRREEEVDPEIDFLCRTGVLDCEDGLIQYKASAENDLRIGEFVEACHDRSRRLALIALVLHRIARG